MVDDAPAISSDLRLAASDGAPILARLWSVPGPRGVLVVAHGFGEHGGSYRQVAETLARSLGIDVLAFDFRGHGRSAGRRGVVRRYSDLKLDLASALDWAGAERPGLPRFLLGHSNGGLVSILSVLDRDPGLSGLILSNPSIRLTADAPAWKVVVGRLLDRLAPSITLDAGLSDSQLTQDPEVLAAIAKDPLCHRRIGPAFYFGMDAGGPVALARAAEIRVPVLLLLGGEDRITDPAAGRLFFDRLASPDKALRFYAEMRHEPLNDANRAGVIEDIARWMGARLSGPA